MTSYKDHPEYHLPLKDKMGRWRTGSLFLETCIDGFTPIFTLKEYNHRDCYSLKLIYLTYDHVPNLEYEFALDVFGSWEHFKKLEKSVLRQSLKEWREELEIRNSARAIKQMMGVSRQSNAAGAAASKYIADKGYIVKRGRPSKEEIERQKKIDMGVEQELNDDMERLQLRIAK